jgi:hypothetical protein
MDPLQQSRIILVSGLPRSGTSLMMKILEVGGIPVVMDNVRKPDPDNPKGYYEYEAVKKIKENASWLKHARGKAIKIISTLLMDLPAEEFYKIIFMERKLDEILRSQEKMLKRKNTKPPADNVKMAVLFTQHLQIVHQWLEKKKNIEVLFVNYNTLMALPHLEIDRIIRFLPVSLDREKMIRVIDPQLYRNRTESYSSFQ